MEKLSAAMIGELKKEARVDAEPRVANFRR
jgi:hypothetical protein